MSVQEVKTRRVGPRRIRHQVLDGVSVAGFSLGASLAATQIGRAHV